MISSGRLLTTTAMLVIFATMSVIALDFPAKARFMPLVVGIPATIICSIQLVLDLISAYRRAGDETGNAAERIREIKLFAWLLVFFVGILCFGFTYAPPVLVFCFMKFGEKEDWLLSIAGAAGAYAVLYGVFYHLMDLQLFEGFVFGALL